MKLAIGLENFKGVFARELVCVASDDLSFASDEIDRNYSLTLPSGNVCVTRGLPSNDRGSQRRVSLGTRFGKLSDNRLMTLLMVSSRNAGNLKLFCA